MKIAIITHARRAPDSYSPPKLIRSQVFVFKKYNHDVKVICPEGSIADFGAEKLDILPNFKRIKNVVNPEYRDKIAKILTEALKDFDIAITHDFYIDDCITYREAFKLVKTDIRWAHVACSGIGSQIDFKMPRTKYIYKNYSDADRFAKSLGVTVNDVRVVFNIYDPRIIFNWHEISSEIVDKYEVFNKDIVQTYPICSTRFDAKGLNEVIEVFTELKKLNNRVLLIIANSNARKLKQEVENRLNFAYSKGLNKDEILFTSTLRPDTLTEVPRKVVLELMSASNLFVFPTKAEVCPNILLEASAAGQLVVVNKNLRSLFDFVQENREALAFPFGSNYQPSFRYHDIKNIKDLASVINEQLKNSKINLSKRRVLKDFNMDTIYKNQLEPLLFERY